MTDPVGPEPLPGAAAPLQRIAHYTLNSVVAEGGMGVVYRATDDTLDRFVALKVIRDPSQAERLIQEARLVSRVHHPAIAAVYQAGIDEATGLAFIAFEWVEGSSLRLHLADGPLAMERFDAYARDLAAAVAHAHHEGLVHGDLKADNVVVTLEGRLKLLDFGLSAPAEEITQGDLWGTPAYMAPELLEGGPRSEATDLFALGVLLYEMATGSLPFGGEDGDETRVRERQLEVERVDVRERRPDFPAAVTDLIAGLVALDPARRGPSAAEVERLARLRTRQPHRRRRAPLLLMLAALLAIGWAYRERLPWIGTPSGSGGASDGSGNGGTLVAPTEVRPRLGAWIDPVTGGVSAESRFGRELLTLFLNGDDPGSALLELDADGAGSDDGTGDAAGDGSASALLEGSWGRVGDAWEARWTAPWLPPQQEAVSVRAADPVALALAVVAAVSAEERVVATPAATLARREKALASFIEALRATSAGRLTEARASFARARDEAGSFPEAAAWEAAVRLVLGDHDGAAAVSAEAPATSSQPGRTLAAVLRARMDRSVRWGRGHRLARLVDLVLDANEPRTPDGDLVAGLEAQRGTGIPALALLEARLALASGAPARARSELPRLRSLGVAEWRVRTIERALLAVEGRANEGDDRLKEWLLDLDRTAPGYFLVVPMALADGRLSTAVSRARRLEPANPESRRAVALTLALAGDFDAAAEVARTVRLPFDPGAGERLVAAVAALRGDLAGAADALERARGIDPERAELKLLEAALGDPYGLSDAPDAGASRLGRWSAPFHALARARRTRLAGDPAAARRMVLAQALVSAELEILDWPELGYLLWLERIACLHDEGDGAAARRELVDFRGWWHEERPEASRVEQGARQVEQLLKGESRGQ